MGRFVMDAENLLMASRRQAHLIKLLGVGFGLSVLTCFMLGAYIFRSTTTTILVPGIKNKYEISSSGFHNRQYLEDMALATVYNFKNISSENFAYNKEKILGIVHPEKRGEFANTLDKAYKIIKNRRLSTTFRPNRILTIGHKNLVKIDGQLSTYIGSKRVGEIDKSYEVQFVSHGMTLYLLSFKEVTEEEKDESAK